MGKFNYKKWVTNLKHGKLNEQITPSTGLNCELEDFKATGQCAQDNFFNSPMGNLGGGPTSFDSWLSNQWDAYSGNAGCNQFPAILNWIGQQITPNASCPALPGMSAYGSYGGGPNLAGNCHSLIAVKRKYAKMKWADCMIKKCCDDGDPTDPTDPTEGEICCVDGVCQQVPLGGCTPSLPGYTGGPFATMSDCQGSGCEDGDPTDTYRCLNGQCTPVGGPGGQYLTLQDCIDDGCEDPNDPCETFYAMPQAQQDGCCEKCQGNISPLDPCYQYCKCCDPDPGGDDPCKDNPNPECYWCSSEVSQGGPCQQVGGNLGYALANGFNLYSTQAACNAAEPGCRPDDVDPVDPKLIECHQCSPLGYPVGNMFPGPICPQGWTPAALFNPKDCKPRGGGPVDPIDMPITGPIGLGEVKNAIKEMINKKQLKSKGGCGCGKK